MTKLRLFCSQLTKKRFFWPICGLIISFLLFLTLAIVILVNKDVPKVDIAVRDFAYQIRGEEGGFGYWFNRIATEFGFVYVIIFLFICFMISTRVDLRTAVLGIGTLVTYIMNELVKLIFMRPRPIEANQWMSESSTSFPSGHSMTSMFFYMLIAYFIFNSFRPSKKMKKVMCSISVFIVFLVGFTRIMLGVHYFTDVIGGFSLGFFNFCLAIIIYQLLNDKGYKFLSRFFIKEDISE